MTRRAGAARARPATALMDRAFARLATDYEQVNREIFSIESEESPTTDEVLETLKKRRLLLKDEIASFLRNMHRRM